MKTVQVLLRETVQHVGKVGDVVEVATGYARNYLVPRKLAVDATPANIELMKRRRARYDAEEVQRSAEIEARVARISAVSVTTVQKADEGGHLYGSVNAAAIAKLLGEAGHAVEERDVRLAEPIKSVGSHAVDVHVHGDRAATITVVVEAAEA
jgi:large subunit ribosomal protein L9